MAKIIVKDVKEPPAIGKPEMMSGIRTKDAAEKWAVKNGYLTVYFWKARERVYADKTSRVDVAAQAMAKKSTDLLVLAERGQGLIEYLLMLVIVGIILLILLKDVPW